MAPSKHKKDLTTEVVLGEGVQATIQGTILSIKGAKGEVQRDFASKDITITSDAEKVVLKPIKNNQNNKKLVKTFAAHVRNMVKGGSEGHTYKLKICSGHFPMNVAVKGDQFEVKNFLGEKVPRVLALKQGAKVTVEGEIIVVESTNKETAGQVSADIEKLTRRTGYDPRIFQDGIYIIHKDGKDLA